MDIGNRRYKAAGQRCFAAIVLALHVQCAGAPPANDNFANRTILTGSSNEFAGTLEEATIERDSESGRNEVIWSSFLLPGPPASVWWSWTALETQVVTLQIIDLPFESFHSDGVAVWALSNIVAFPTNQFPVDPLALIWADGVVPGMWVAFMAEAGQEYQLQLVGPRRGNFKLRLVAGGEPFIFEQPRSQTVPVGGSAMFGVMAAGPTPFYYHWFRDGIELQGLNGPTLALTALELQHAGDYSVVVSNAYGATTSQVAVLEVRDLDVRPFLSQSRMVSTNFEFVLNAESNRHYRIESSTNGTTWLPAEHFYRDGLSRKTSVLDISNSTTSVSVPADTNLKLFRTRLYIPDNHVCNNNLRRLRYAKAIWARQFHKVRWHTAQAAELPPYMNMEMPRCPDGGFYTIATVQMFPTCTYTNHVLEEPW